MALGVFFFFRQWHKWVFDCHLTAILSFLIFPFNDGSRLCGWGPLGILCLLLYNQFQSAYGMFVQILKGVSICIKVFLA